MKIFLPIILSVFLAGDLFSQTGFTYGFGGGVLVAGEQPFRSDSIQYQHHSDFLFFFMAEYYFTDRASIRLQPSYQSRSVTNKILQDFLASPFSAGFDNSVECIDLPLALKYNVIDAADLQVSLFAGASLQIPITGNWVLTDTGGSTTILNYTLTGGIDIAHYFSDRIGLFLEGGYMYGLRDLSTTPNAVYSRDFRITAGFVFGRK